MTDMSAFSGDWDQKSYSSLRGELEVTKAALYRLVRQGRAIRENRDAIVFIWECFREPTLLASAAQEAFEELSTDDQIALWTAPSRGGIWESWERDVLKHGEIKQTFLTAMARKGIPVPIELENRIRQKQKGRR